MPPLKKAAQKEGRNMSASSQESSRPGSRTAGATSKMSGSGAEFDVDSKLVALPRVATMRAISPEERKQRARE